jgi:hypothetical protein
MNRLIEGAERDRFGIKIGNRRANEMATGGFAVHKIPSEEYDFETKDAEEAINEMAYRQVITQDIINDKKEYLINVDIFGALGYKFGESREPVRQSPGAAPPPKSTRTPPIAWDGKLPPKIPDPDLDPK